MILGLQLIQLRTGANSFDVNFHVFIFERETLVGFKELYASLWPTKDAIYLPSGIVFQKGL